jgi:hypothetical protein
VGVLATIEGLDPNERIVVELDGGRVGGLVLCRQSWSDSVGWFTQSRMALDGNEVSSLRGVLGNAPSNRVARPVVNQEMPRVLQFPAAVSA